MLDIASATRTETGVSDPVVVSRTYDGRSELLTEHLEVANGFEYDLTWTYGDAGRMTAVSFVSIGIDSP